MRPLTLDDVGRDSLAGTGGHCARCEVVSKGSERTDRWHKPVEYAAAGIRRFWRVEPDGVVNQFELAGTADTQVGGIALDALLAGPVPDLS